MHFNLECNLHKWKLNDHVTLKDNFIANMEIKAIA